MNLSGEVALKALRESLEGKRSPAEFACTDVPFERFRLCLISPQLSAVDRAVRLRHALRYADLTLTGNGVKHTLPLPDILGWPDAVQCREFGLHLRPGSLVEASPWCPDWLSELPKDGVDATSMIAGLRPWQNRPPRIDPFVASTLGFACYKGPGQALAVRCALHLPSHKTILVLLPTGEGKA